MTMITFNESCWHCNPPIAWITPEQEKKIQHLPIKNEFRFNIVSKETKFKPFLKPSQSQCLNSSILNRWVNSDIKLYLHLLINEELCSLTNVELCSLTNDEKYKIQAVIDAIEYKTNAVKSYNDGNCYDPIYIHIPSIHMYKHQHKAKEELKSFSPTAATILKTHLHVTTVDECIRSFQYVFQIDLLDINQIRTFKKLMDKYMMELDYDPSDKNDVKLFYSKENPHEIYRINYIRTSICGRACVDMYNLDTYGDYVEFLGMVKSHMSSIVNPDTQNVFNYDSCKEYKFFLQNFNNHVDLVNMMNKLSIK